MRLSFLLAAAALCTGTAFAQGNEPVSYQAVTMVMAKAEATTGENVPSIDALAVPENNVLLQQEKPRKAEKQKGKEQPKEEQKVKEVATAKRQGKPEKVSSDAEAYELISRGSAGRPQSAARPGRGANAGSAVKAVGNAAKAAKSAKPVKVGGLGVGRIKVGKN